MKTIRDLKAAIAKSGMKIDIEESRPHEMDNCGQLNLELDHEHKMQFCATDATICAADYYSDIPGSRGLAIESLMKDLAGGFEPMSQETADACGVDL